MPKRGNHEGHIRQRPDGRWEAQYTAGYKADGRPNRRSVYGKEREEVQKKLRAIAQQLDESRYVEPSAVTVEKWLRTWFDEYFRTNHRASTASVYDSHINTHLVPALGAMKLQKLRPEHIQAMINDERQAGLSAGTVRKTVEVLKCALNQAVDNGLIPWSPADKVVQPKAEQKDIDFLTPSEVAALVKELPDSTSGRALLFILNTGLRVSEVCGLRWQDVQLKQFSIRQVIMRTKAFDGKANSTELTAAPPKTKASQRDIPLLPAARRIIDRERLVNRANRLRAGALWADNDLVFCTPVGTPKDPANLRRTLSDALKKAGLKHRGIHALRHTFATNAIHSGMDVSSLAAIIGHTKIAFTLQTYVHSDMEQKRKAMESMPQFQ